MKVLIVEDETAAFENIKEILTEVDPEISIVGNTESVSQTLRWLNTNPQPDLIFMDIHLSDGSAFSIFEQTDLHTPIIFTTAYDNYAIEAFKVNSIDYILKPIKREEISQALNKHKRLSSQNITQYIAHLQNLIPNKQYKEKLLIPHKDKLLPINLNEVAYFYTSDKNTTIGLNDGTVYPISKTLEQIAPVLNPTDFFRANKQFIIRKEAVTDITIWFDSRLLIKLNTALPERIYVSKNKAAEFKTWMVNG